jgi:hypothetical protein
MGGLGILAFSREPSVGKDAILALTPHSKLPTLAKQLFIII